MDERFKEDLASLYESPVRVPIRVDDAILNRARARRAGWRGRRLLLTAGAAAACIVLVARFSMQESSPQRVDIIDALKLAHQIDAGKGRDVNKDGAIDRRDVDALAMLAVRLDGGVQ